MTSINSTGSPYKTRSQTSTTHVEQEENDVELDEKFSPLDGPTSTIHRELDYPPTPSISLRSFISSSNSRVLPSLPPADTGRQAYLFLLSSFIVETVVWGLPSSYGVFFQYYTDNGVGVEGDMTGASLLPLVGSVSSGLMYLLGPPTAYILNRKPHWRTTSIRLGCLICVLALLLSSWATKAYQLLLTQGLLYSIGGSMAYYPTFSFLSEWFIARRGFAIGVTFAGTALGGLVSAILASSHCIATSSTSNEISAGLLTFFDFIQILPFALDYLLSHYKTGITLQVLAGASFILLAIALPFLKPRIPLGSSTSSSARDHSTSTKIWKNKRLIVFLIANTAQAIGFFLPLLYLPTFAGSLNLSGAEGSGLLACVNATSVLSRVLVGILSDRMNPHRIAGVTMALSSLAVLILWGVAATSFTPLLVFSLVLGAVAGGWTSLYSKIVQDSAKDDPAVNSTLFGLISFSRGLGSILTAPLSSFLVSHGGIGAAASTGFGVAGGEYGSLVLVSGLALAVASGVEFAIAF